MTTPATAAPTTLQEPAVLRTGGRLAALDGLRFLAALSVALFHLLAVAGYGYGVNAWGEPPDAVFGLRAFQIASFGWVGVPLFFMISGFVICMSSWGRTPAQFAVSRFTRLYPAYWVSVLLTTAVVTVYSSVYKPLPYRDVLTNLTMFQEPLGVSSVDNVYWTLWVEMRFYLLFLLVIWLGLTYRRVVTFCLVWGIASMAAPAMNLDWLNAIVVPGHGQYFIAGIAMYLMYRHGPRLILWLIIGFSWLISMHYRQGNPFNPEHLQPFWPGSLLTTLCFGVMILLALGKLDWLRWRGLTTLGAITYPLYLLHDQIGTTAINELHGVVALQPVALLAAVLAGLILLAWLVHRLVERPLAPRLRRALNRPLAREPQPGGHARSSTEPTPPQAEPTPAPAEAAPATRTAEPEIGPGTWQPETVPAPRLPVDGPMPTHPDSPPATA